MARLFTSGAEWNDPLSSTTVANAEGLVFTGNAPTVSTSAARSGTYGWAGAGVTARYLFTGATATTYYARGYYNFDTLTATATTILGFSTSAPANLAQIRFNADGTLSVCQGSSFTVIGTTVGAITTSSWFMVELAVLIGASTNDDYVEGRLDGVSIASSTTLNLGTTAPNRIDWSTSFASATSWMDDIALNDSTGATQKTWPGSGKVVLLTPASDSAVGTGWTLGTGTAISANSGSTAVKNKPPLGVADLAVGSDTKQIRNATSNANVNYDANLTTYTAAGIGASDTLNVLVPVVATGAPLVTSAKAGTYGISSNPAIANVALGAAGTAGAFWQGNAAGTYPTGWKWSFGTTTYAPTVTLGTAPVARITQVTASTRIAIVCAMGMYVDYTPGVPALPPLPVYVDSAVARSTSY